MTAEKDPSTLELSRDEMRAMGYQVVDILVEHFATLHDQPVRGWASRADLEARFREPAPDGPSDPAAVLARLGPDLCRSSPGSPIRGISPSSRSPATSSAP